MAYESGIASQEISRENYPMKERVIDYIKTHPGTHLRQIKRDLNISMGVIQHHLYCLERDRRVLSRRSGLYKRFYPNLVFGDHQRDLLDVLSLETERDIVLYLIRYPNTTQKNLSEHVQISAGTVNWHMKRLIESGLVIMKREGQFVKYTVNGQTDEILNLVRSYHPSIWERWADRFGNALNEVSQSSA